MEGFSTKDSSNGNKELNTFDPQFAHKNKSDDRNQANWCQF